jgi:glutathione-regulated potassium-efflux system ancillary protein KefF
MPQAPEVPARPPAEIVVIVAHPALEHSRVTRRLLGELSSGPGARSGRVDVRDLYARYPDYFIDVAAEQAALKPARLVVWLQPIHWYSMPPLLKLWLDEVFAFGWAYGPGGHALHGKDLWLVASTGGPEASYQPSGYNRYFFDAFLPPYEQTAALTGMRWLPPLVLHGAHRVDAAEIEAHAAVLMQRLATWPDWPELADLDAAAACDVPADARPEAGR